MSRKEKRITLREGDQSIHFVVRQMPLTQIELFTIRLASLLAASAKDAPEFNNLAESFDWLRKQGLGVLLSCLGHLDTGKAEPLLNELLGCCSHVVGAVETRCAPDNIDGYLSEIGSLLALRKEALAINFGFFTEAVEKFSASRDGTPG